MTAVANAYLTGSDRDADVSGRLTAGIEVGERK